MRSFARYGRRDFQRDPRYDLKNVTEGFAKRLNPISDDAELLKRICAAYIATIEHPESDQGTFHATGWWQGIRHRSLGPVRQALQMRDIPTLQRLYSNFFRDPCSTGLTSVPYGMVDAYFGGKMTDLHRRVYLADTLYRFDYWKQETAGRFNLSDLATPSVGNPFGAYIEGTLITSRAEYHHYCASKIASLLEPNPSTVAEIGGGFGGMACFLLRDHPLTKYFDFDVPESIALATYYLIKAFPHKRFLLFGEGSLTDEALTDADVVLMPLFVMKHLQAASFNVTFSSHAMNDLELEVLTSYIETVLHVTRDYFLFLGSAVLPEFSRLIAKDREAFPQSEWRRLRWNAHRSPYDTEVECVYSFKPADQKRHSTKEELAYVDR